MLIVNPAFNENRTMFYLFTVGQESLIEYNGKCRFVRVREVGPTWIRCECLDGSGYRTFTIEKITMCE